MHIDQKINVLCQLGKEMRDGINKHWIENLVEKAYRKNPWFTPENIRSSLNAISTEFLTIEALNAVNEKYFLRNVTNKTTIGLVLAGNIPAVGFHDILCVFLTDHKAQIKCSSKDDVIIPALIDRLITIDGKTAAYFELVERLKDYNGIIATGGNNTSRYFEYYFKDVPSLIRKSRSSVAILTGKESEKELLELGKDIFSYFGLGCRNVSKILIPEGYDLKVLLKALDQFEELAHHNKYKNNFDYSMALYLLNKEDILANNCIILRENEGVSSRIACLHYQTYKNASDLDEILRADENEIQCIIGKYSVAGIESFQYGESQKPGILDYADGVDTIQFLIGIDE